MTLVQFKGVIEKRFFCDIPDEFLFLPSVNLLEISKAVKLGTLTAAQRQGMDQGVSHDPQTKRGSNSATTVINQNQPLCPWFTCCY
jgi:hypothetical protein